MRFLNRRYRDNHGKRTRHLLPSPHSFAYLPISRARTKRHQNNSSERLHSQRPEITRPVPRSDRSAFNSSGPPRAARDFATISSAVCAAEARGPRARTARIASLVFMSSLTLDLGGGNKRSVFSHISKR